MKFLILFLIGIIWELHVDGVINDDGRVVNNHRNVVDYGSDKIGFFEKRTKHIFGACAFGFYSFLVIIGVNELHLMILLHHHLLIVILVELVLY